MGEEGNRLLGKTRIGAWGGGWGVRSIHSKAQRQGVVRLGAPRHAWTSMQKKIRPCEVLCVSPSSGKLFFGKGTPFGWVQRETKGNTPFSNNRGLRRLAGAIGGE